MDLGAVFFLLAALILTGMYLYAPFVSRLRAVNSQEEHELSSWMAERDRVINALQELDFDHSLGKIPPEDYPAQRSELLRKGAEVLRRLDTLQPASAPGPDVESRIEDALAARRADGMVVRDASPAAAPELTDDDIETLIAARRSRRREKSAGFCPRCGQAVLVRDRFCPSCGKSLN